MRIIRGKHALVTGAASGIGRAIALGLAREGVHLHLLDIDAAGLEAVVASAQQLGVAATGERCDLAQPAAITAALAPFRQRQRPIDILVNNAGVAYYGPTENMTAEQWDWLLKINLQAPIQIVRELLPALLDLPEAHILNVSSIFGLIAVDQAAAYHVSKYALVGFSESLRTEYAARHLGVTVLCPGFVRTNLYRTAVSGRDRPTPEPPAWLCVAPERVAQKAIRAIYRNRGLVIVSRLARFLWLSKRFAPGFLASIYRARLKRKRQASIERAKK